MAAEIQKQLRGSDIFCRLGGEEFAVLLVHKATDAARQLSERIRQYLSEITVHFNGAAIKFTVSIGVAGFHGADDNLEFMLKRADEALYQAKTGGRNRVVVKERTP